MNWISNQHFIALNWLWIWNIFSKVNGLTPSFVRFMINFHEQKYLEKFLSKYLSQKARFFRLHITFSFRETRRELSKRLMFINVCWIKSKVKKKLWHIFIFAKSQLTAMGLEPRLPDPKTTALSSELISQLIWNGYFWIHN